MRCGATIQCYRKTLQVLPFLLAICQASAQNKNTEMSKSLTSDRFENVRVVETDSAIFVSFEDNLFRWNVDGIKVALGSITSYQETNKHLRLICLKRAKNTFIN
jgi:hypothetical protein